MEYLSQSISGRPAVLIASTLLTSLAVICLYLVRSQKQVSGLPPSPPAHPLWGHATILTAPFQWKIFTELGKDLGKGLPIIRVAGHSVLTVAGREHHLPFSAWSAHCCTQFGRGCAGPHGKAWFQVLRSCGDNSFWGYVRSYVLLSYICSRLTLS